MRPMRVLVITTLTFTLGLMAGCARAAGDHAAAPAIVVAPPLDAATRL